MKVYGSLDEAQLEVVAGDKSGFKIGRVFWNSVAAAVRVQSASVNFTLMFNPMTTAGDITYGAASGVPTRLAAGTTSQALIIAAGIPAWGTLPLLGGGTGATTKAGAFDALSPMTTSGDILYGGASGTGTRIGIGSSSQALMVVGGIPAWTTMAFSNISGSITNAQSTATAANNASAIVARDGSGNFVAGTITAALTGNASTATLASTVTTNANLTGPVTSVGNATSITNLAITNAMIAASTIDLTAKVTGTLPLANGGTAATTKAGAFDSLSPMTTSGDIIYGGASGTGTRLAKGSDGQALVLASGLPSWGSLAISGGGTGASTKTTGFDALSPMTTSGDIIYGGASGTGTRLAKGSDGQVLSLASGIPAWSTAAASFANPMTTAGDIIVGGASGVAARLAKGTDYQYLTQASGTPAWSWGQGDFQSKTTTYTALISDKYISVTTASAWTLALPTASGNKGKEYFIKKTSTDFNALTIDPNGSETLAEYGTTTTTTTINTQEEKIHIVSDGTNWVVVERVIPTIVTSLAPTASVSVGCTTNATYTGVYWREGKNLHVQGKAAFSGATDNNSASIDCPSGLTFDYTSFIGTVTQIVGTFNGSYAGLTGFVYGVVRASTLSSNYVVLGWYRVTGTHITCDDMPQSPVAPANTDYWNFDYCMPITGWKS